MANGFALRDSTTGSSTFSRSRRTTPYGRGKSALIIIFALGAALVLGVGTALAGIWMALLGVGVFAGAFSFAMPLQWLLLLDVVLATLVAGSIEYFLGMSQAHWIPYLLGFLLSLRALMERGQTSPGHVGGGTRAVPSGVWFKLPAIVYVALLVGSSVLNLSPGLQVITGTKNFLFMWGVLFAMLAVRDWEVVARNAWRVIVVVCCVQLPVTLYQRIFIASKAHNHVPWDSVVGTFGGIPLFGGHSGSMALFISAGLVWLLIAWRDGDLPISRVFLYVVFAISSVLLAEVKAIVVWLGLGLTLVFARYARTRPMMFVGGMLLNGFLVLGVAIAYVTFNYSGGQDRSLEDIYKRQITYIYDTQRFNPKTRELGRVSSVVFWAKQQKLSEPVSFLVGNGMGSSRGLATFGRGVVAKRYTFFIDTSSLTVLLWDTGIIGTGAFVAMLLLAGWQGMRLGRDDRLPAGARRLAEVSGIVLFLILVGVAYTRDAVDDTSVQFLMFLCLACVVRSAALSVAVARGLDGQGR